MASGENFDVEYRVVMVGKTGTGKSSLCNSLIGKKHFKISKAAESGTKKCGRKVVFLKEINALLTVIDTPGLFDTYQPNEETLDEIIKCIALASPGPHIFLFVISIRRFTKEEKESIEILEKLFEEDVIKHVIVVFTGKDTLDDDDDDDDDDDQIKTIEDYIKKSPSDLRHFLKKCDNRYVGISNKTSYKTHKSDVAEVLDLVMSTVKRNNNQYYEQKLFKKAEEIIQNKVDEEKAQTPQKTEQEIREEIMRELEDKKSSKTGIWADIKAGLVELIGVVAPVLIKSALGAAATFFKAINK